MIPRVPAPAVRLIAAGTAWGMAVLPAAIGGGAALAFAAVAGGAGFTSQWRSRPWAGLAALAAIAATAATPVSPAFAFAEGMLILVFLATVDMIELSGPGRQSGAVLHRWAAHCARLLPLAVGIGVVAAIAGSWSVRAPWLTATGWGGAGLLLAATTRWRSHPTAAEHDRAEGHGHQWM